jgi:hypothetical protein
MNRKEITKRLEAIRKSIKAECISTNEIVELQSLSKFIEPGDVELLEWAGVPEFKEEEEKIVKKSDIYFNVQGIDPHRERLNLGYTSDPVAWCLNSNGWDINKLIFVAMVKK